MSGCTRLTETDILKAFKNVVERSNTTIISKLDLVDKVSKELKISPEHLKACYLSAFLCTNMSKNGWKFDSENEVFKSRKLTHHGEMLLRGLRHAKWNELEIEAVKQMIQDKCQGIITSGSVDPDQVTFKNRDLNVSEIIQRKDLKI